MQGGFLGVAVVVHASKRLFHLRHVHAGHTTGWPMCCVDQALTSTSLSLAMSMTRCVVAWKGTVCLLSAACFLRILYAISMVYCASSMQPR